MAELRLSDCSLAVSKPLFLVLIISITLKLITCVIVIWNLGSDESLVTPGDVIASFISTPDDNKHGSHGATTQMQIRKTCRKPRDESFSMQMTSPARWSFRHHSRRKAIPRAASAGTYFMTAAGMFVIFCLFFYSVCLGAPLSFISEAGESSSLMGGIPSGATFLSSLVVVNIPQLYFSFFYVLYNTLVTRLQMSQEWASYSIDFNPLRVTRPNLTLVVLSTLMHWLLSNALYIVVSHGDYYQASNGYLTDTISLPTDVTLVVGTAPLPVLLIIIIVAVMCLFVLERGRSILPGSMPIVGSNSLAIAAACQLSPLTKVPGFHREDEANTKEM
ncbi:hypothetical protein K456DRAFT_31777 [Colletotrichum gloeosporioides 23]|nr:hypothetical protein K456DRAFT_31777 [Colletotrichum gloeosporioides 23]